MTAITLVLGESRIVGELISDEATFWYMQPHGAAQGNTFYKKDGWQVEHPPFVFPTARSAVIAPVDEKNVGRWFSGEEGWKSMHGQGWTEGEILALNIPLRVIFAGEVE